MAQDLHKAIQFRRDVFWRNLGVIALEGFARFIDEEFGEVPGDRVFAFLVSQFTTEPLIQW